MDFSITLEVNATTCAGHLKVDSIQHRLNAISEAHTATGNESPTHAATVRNTLKVIRLAGIDAVAKKLAQRAGLDATKYAGHYLRAGHAISAAIAGA